jgi:hypothetical protein
MPVPSRGRALTIAAVLFGVLGVSDVAKPFVHDSQTGFVFLGLRLTGTANAIIGPLFGLYLAAYARGIWGMRRFALPMGRLYAAYVLVNLMLFPFRTAPPPDAGAGWHVFTLVYAIVAIGVSVGTCRLLAARRAELV